jgi:hypothetical protein
MQQTKEVREQMFQKSFCEQASIPYHVFHYRYKLYRESGKAISSSFVKLEVDPPVSFSSVELICPDGKRLLFHQFVSVDYLKALTIN